MHAGASVAAFILAGGKSMRMGSDKAFIKFRGRMLLAQALDLASAVSSDVRIVGDPVKFATFGPVVQDVFAGCGPLGGIHAALCSSSAELNLIVAVDMPFLTPDLLRYLVERARNSSAIVTLPRRESGNQPLCAVYRRAFAEAAENALKHGRYKIDALFANESTLVIDKDELEANGCSAEMFRNLNTPDELARAQR